MWTLCEVCGHPLSGHYCTASVCRKCCEENKCPYREECLAYYEWRILMAKYYGET